jgi:hypothetical protein
MSLDIDGARSYATEGGLRKALTKLGLSDDRPLVVCNRQGRYTAIFHLAHARDQQRALSAPHRGFLLFN